MDETEQGELETLLRGKFFNLSADLVSAAIVIYREIEKYHERHIRLTAEQFAVARRDFDLLWKCVLCLVAIEWAKDPTSAPLLLGMDLVPELGGRRGWVRLALKLPSRPPSKKT